MAAELINVFSYRQDVAGIAALLRRMVPGVSISGGDDSWEWITIEEAKSWFRKAPRLTFKNVPDYYRGPDWPNQVAGMRGYFSRFPDVSRKPDVLRLIGSFRFALATESYPALMIESSDPRLKLLFAVAQHLDGVLFTPSGLWDAAGRPLLCADGRSDSAAVLPAIPQSKEGIASGEGTEGGGGPERIPPDAKRVARQTLCLAALAGRGLLEVEQMSPERAESKRKSLLAWVGELALENEIEPKELELLRQPVGTLPRQAAVNAVWRLEGLGVLTWALGRFELPAYDRLVDTEVLLPAAGFLDLGNATALLAAPTLRSREELRRLQNQCFALHWRLRAFRLDRKPMNFRTVARDCWFGPLDVSLARFRDDDLLIGKTPIGKTPEDGFRTALSTANERHLAINWLVDGGETYSETDTST